MGYLIGPFVCGALFAVGLGVSGMTESANIIAFLDVFGDWKPDLMAVMVGALVSYGVFFKWVTKRSQPVFESTFSIPPKRSIDGRLIVGAILFGLGWGITGLCPGPGIAAVSSGTDHIVVFLLTLLVGTIVGRSKFGMSFLSKD